MSDEAEFVKPLKGFQACLAPNSPTVGVLVLETFDGSSQAFALTKQGALDISQALAKLAEGIAESQ